MDQQTMVKWSFVAIYLMAIIIELVWAFRKQEGVYNLKDSLSNFVIVLGGKLTKSLALAWGYFLFTLVEPYQVATIPINGFTLVLTFFVVELVYYWYHRISHEVPLLWTIHHTHHSSPWFNFTTAGRLNWLGKFTSQIFYLPLILIGFAPQTITLFLGLSLVYQVFIHTKMIGKLGFLEGWLFNTPSAHRVHHGSNLKYLDKNYGGTLILFDRLFGTYQPEEEEVKYGVTTGFIGFNPFVIVFKPIIDYFKGETQLEKVNIEEINHEKRTIIHE